MRLPKLLLIILLALGLTAVAALNCWFMLAETDFSLAEGLSGLKALQALAAPSLATYLLQSGQPLSPPLSIAGQVAGFELFGLNQWAPRVFSGFFTLGTALLTAAFATHKRNLLTGALAGGMLLTARSFITVHNARSGTEDALLIFLYSLALFIVLWDERGSYRYYLAGFCAFLALLVSGFYALPLGLTLLVLYVHEGRLSGRSLLKLLLILAVSGLPLAAWLFFLQRHDSISQFWSLLSYNFASLDAGEQASGASLAFYYIKPTLKDFKFWLVGIMGAMAVLHMGGCRVGSFLSGLKNPLHCRLLLCVGIPLCIYSALTPRLAWNLFCAFPCLAVLVASAVSYSMELLLAAGTGRGKFILAIALALFMVEEALTLQGIVDASYRGKDQVQAAIRELSQKTGNKEALLFLDKGAWTPQQELAGKLYGNFTLQPGGRAAYASSPEKNIFLIITPE